ncbi:hypothetical protein PENTCL1PPCAC_23529 [Pristionchus entomophagus]|uniref:BTB domain-containing protein n=1 Tax=Pristionchus entomophagus TaxID=358040 RepID=A0AAV5U3F6_9BILA|nr:hypothetical protein PENTCL1PPCAC_23529 [Pristionchus entomophagus]
MSVSEAEAPGVDEHDAGGSEGDTTSSSIESRRETREEERKGGGGASGSRSWEGSSGSSSSFMHSSVPSSGYPPTSLFSTLPAPAPTAPATASSAASAAAPTPKRIFSTAGSSSTLSTHRHSTFSDCGSDMARSLDDLTLNSLNRLDDKSEGTIRLHVPQVSSLRTKTNTSFHMIANLPWRLAAKTECSKRTSQLKFFSVYIDCNPESESTLWHCDAVVEFRLVNQRDEKHHFARHFTNKFNYNSNNWGFPSFIEWTELLAPEKGFTKADRVIVEARITVNKVVGVRQKPRFHFLSPSMDLSDTALVINGVKLHISRQYLALYSPVFAAMFYGRFQEREKTEIPIEDVILEEFMELLEVVYPSHKAVSADNVEYLLDLGDKFQIQFVMDEAEKFLMATDEIAVVTKLLWADQYCLARLQDACIRTFKSPGEIKQVKSSEEYKNLSDKTRAALFEKILKLIPS